MPPPPTHVHVSHSNEAASPANLHASCPIFDCHPSCRASLDRPNRPQEAPAESESSSRVRSRAAAPSFSPPKFVSTHRIAFQQQRPQLRRSTGCRFVDPSSDVIPCHASPPNLLPLPRPSRPKAAASLSHIHDSISLIQTRLSFSRSHARISPASATFPPLNPHARELQLCEDQPPKLLLCNSSSTRPRPLETASSARVFNFCRSPSTKKPMPLKPTGSPQIKPTAHILSPQLVGINSAQFSLVQFSPTKIFSPVQL